MTDASEKQAATADDKVAVVIVAAGRGERAGQADGPKQYQSIGGRAVIAHTLDMFLAHPKVGPSSSPSMPTTASYSHRATGANADRVIAVTGGAVEAGLGPAWAACAEEPCAEPGSRP